jgi:putative alpha-1,2-mannosidase
MSAWYLFTSLGFYPVAPGSGQYVIGRPFLDGAEIRLENGKTFTVKVHKRSDANRYLGSVHLNGRPLSRTWISHQEILDGGTLEFHMAKEANRSWGRTASSRPYSLSNSPGERRLTDKE